MSIYLEIVDHEAVFQNLTTIPYIINNVDITLQEEKEKLNDLLYTRYEGDALDIVPKCDCGCLTGEYNRGLVCDNCNTEVISVTEKPLESVIWIAAPKGVDSLINPTVWSILSASFTISGCNLIEWLCNPSYQPQNEIPFIKNVPAHWVRSLNFFYNHFDEIMERLLTIPQIRRDTEFHGDIEQFVRENRQKIFSKHIPFPSRIGFITEATSTGTYVDGTIAAAMDAVRTISSIESSVSPVSQRVREARTVRAISQLAMYYRTFMKDTLGGKHGVFRKHIFGSRTHFTGRAVISSLSENHDYEELHLPWGLSVNLFKMHLTAKLLDRGYFPRQITDMFNECVNQYSPLLDELFRELIEESPYKGIPCILQRNPSLARLSAQMFYVTRIKTDPAIKTISMSVLCLKGPNADFDGDELNFMLILDHEMHDKLRRLAPHLGTMDLRKPRMVSGNLAMPAPVLATMNNFFSEQSNQETGPTGAGLGSTILGTTGKW